MSRDTEDVFVQDGGGSISTPDPAPNPTPGPVPTPPSTPTPTPPPPIRAAPVPIPALPRTHLPAPPTPATDPRYSAEDYRDIALTMRPRGRVWPQGTDSVQGRIFGAIGQMLARLDAAASVVLAGSVPGSDLSPTVPEWEATLDLPDPCAGAAPTFQQRRDQIRARFIGGGGQSRQYYLDLAAALGFDITITNFSPFRCGHSSIDEPLTDDAWTFVWGVTVVSNRGGFPTDLLLCELRAVRPAGTSVIMLT